MTQTLLYDNTSGYLTTNNDTITQVLYLLNTGTMVKVWFTGNGVDSYQVQNAYLTQGVVSIPVTVSGSTSFLVPAFGRWSDYVPTTALSLPGNVTFTTIVKLQVPIVAPVNTGGYIWNEEMGWWEYNEGVSGDGSQAGSSGVGIISGIDDGEATVYYIDTADVSSTGSVAVIDNDSIWDGCQIRINNSSMNILFLTFDYEVNGATEWLEEAQGLPVSSESDLGNGAVVLVDTTVKYSEPGALKFTAYAPLSSDSVIYEVVLGRAFTITSYFRFHGPLDDTPGSPDHLNIGGISVRPTGINRGIGVSFYAASGITRLWVVSETSTTWYNEPCPIVEDTWYKYEMKVVDSLVKIYIDDVLKVEFTYSNRNLGTEFPLEGAFRQYQNVFWFGAVRRVVGDDFWIDSISITDDDNGVIGDIDYIYTFTSIPTGAPNEIIIGSSAADTRQNIVDAINRTPRTLLSASEQSEYYSDIFTLNFEGIDGATTWTEEAQGLIPYVKTGCEIDTAEHYAGSSSLKMANGANLNYTITGLDEFELTFYFLLRADLSNYFYFDMYDDSGVSYIYIDGYTSSGITFYAGDRVGDDFAGYDSGSCTKDVWHKCKLSISGRTFTFYIDDVEVYSADASCDSPMLGIDTLHVTTVGQVLWLDAVTITQLNPAYVAITAHSVYPIKVLTTCDGLLVSRWSDGVEIVYTSSGALATMPAFTGTGNCTDHGILGDNWGLGSFPRFTSSGTGLSTSNDSYTFTPVFSSYGLTHDNYEETINDEIISNVSLGIGFAKTITDSMLIYDLIKIGWAVTTEDSLVLTETLSNVLGITVADWLFLIDSQSNNWNGSETISDTMTLWEVVVGSRHYSDTNEESLVFTDSIPTYKLTITVLEYLGFTELVSAMRSCAESIGDSMVLTDSVDRGFSMEVGDALTVIDTVSVVTLFLNTVSESLGIAVDSTVIKQLGTTINDSIVFVETATSQGSFYNVVYDSLAMNVSIDIGGEIWECYVLNTPKFMPSMYSGFDFNSFCVFENRAFGANDVGIYELTGDTDAGNEIHTGVILSDTDFGSVNQKRFRRGYLGVSGTSPVMVFETETGQRETYSIDTQGKVVVSSDLKSKSWKLSIADFDVLSTVKLIPVILTK